MTRPDMMFALALFSIYLGAEYAITSLLWSGTLFALIAYLFAPKVRVVFVAMLPPATAPHLKEPPVP